VRREHALRRRLESFDMLREAIDAMKALSAHHLRTARNGLAPARAYRDGIDALIVSAGIAQTLPPVDRPAVLLVAADLGLCDGYNTRLTDAAATERHTRAASVVYAIGRRSLPLLRRAGISPARQYPAVTSVSGLTGLLLTLADDVLGDYLTGAFTSLYVVSARFEGVGAFTPISTRVLPVIPSASDARPARTPYSDPAHLAQTAIREYLYSTLFELLLDSLVSEHGMRLVATQAAGQWLEDRLAGLQRELASVRRETSTQEVLDVASGARQRMRRER
jgi:F-type H+-transporting ATPase subunit gamma